MEEGGWSGCFFVWELDRVAGVCGCACGVVGCEWVGVGVDESGDFVV